ncbi:MAG: T9SS type A sorting domain-containing protein [Sphingobacteriales bacterium]|nr:MAG: T9SS type A sorting domain-containing protein [Sphingobacteriales bacterium]
MNICKLIRCNTIFFACLVLFFFIPKRMDAHGGNLPFSTDSTHITMWNGERYVPLFIKGINMGIAVPGTFPSELQASKADYFNWLQLIRDAGYNTIRLYTLHYPHFYEVLDSFNRAHANSPILLFQGVWMEEEVPNYDEDLHTLTPFFNKEIEENVDCVHGNRTIAHRFGKAFGTYTVDVSKWTISYIIGRETHPPEVWHTNEKHAEITAFKGKYLTIQNTKPAESWVIARMDYLLSYEHDKYETQRPVSFSSWPTLDPLYHPSEKNRYEDSASLDISELDFSGAKAGVFASYHAYPYYPDFMSQDVKYSGYRDYLGQNPYLGYLTALKEHYHHMPLIIAEYGVPSSWGKAHYSTTGMHHGGFDEREQGDANMRLLHNIEESGCGGGVQFALMDEWFKRTWITDPMDFIADRRILWQNVMSAEQNFGVMGFRKKDNPYQAWEDLCTNCAVEKLEARADFAYLWLKLKIQKPLPILDTVWIAFDTYDSTKGESILPNGKQISKRAEFALMITNDRAELFVTEAYDLYGIWHKTSAPEQLYRSVPTDGKPWKIVRWKNNNNEQEVQYIGSLRVNRLGLPPTSMDAVKLDSFAIEVKLPWTLLNIIDPSTMMVMNDDRSTAERELLKSDGIAVSIAYNNFFAMTQNRFSWPEWNSATDVVPYLKESYLIAKEQLKDFPGNPMAVTDTFDVKAGMRLTIPADSGLLRNDWSLDGSVMEAAIDRAPVNGLLFVERNGSVTYVPEEGFTGIDSFTYRVIAGKHRSEAVTSVINVTGTPSGKGYLTVYPNPSNGTFIITSRAVIDEYAVTDSYGRDIIKGTSANSLSLTIDLGNVSRGVYFIKALSGGQQLVKRITKM